ncbi:hypothetical protein COV18_03545 [Candidatus Woesearchaeota archaeon CG10_big_fil_rev_8_21_14_0_10_37_12]|nr:MAG: hypothetical protein COV18_03545 [Candidatus Woesearchaeota archaeon CG10_big_fil_rev_8_21_14_0_10_37_12]
MTEKILFGAVILVAVLGLVFVFTTNATNGHAIRNADTTSLSIQPRIEDPPEVIHIRLGEIISRSDSCDQSAPKCQEKLHCTVSTVIRFPEHGETELTWEGRYVREGKCSFDKSNRCGCSGEKWISRTFRKIK